MSKHLRKAIRLYMEDREWHVTERRQMKKQQFQPLTPTALYARVSSDRQGVDLSVADQLRALTMPRRTATPWPASTSAMRRAGESPTAPVQGDDRRGQQAEGSLLVVCIVWIQAKQYRNAYHKASILRQPLLQLWRRGNTHKSDAFIVQGEVIYEVNPERNGSG